MAERQRSFRDMFPDLIGQMTQGAQWKRGMTSLSEKEMALSKERALTQEQRKWKHDQMMKQWLDFGPHGLGGEGGRDPSVASQVLDYTSMWPGNIARKSLQTGIWDRVPAKIKKRIKRQIKEFGETRPEPNPTAVEALEAHEQVSDKMGYNPTDKYVGEPRSPSAHSQDLAGRFLQFLRDKDARTIETIRETRPDPDRDMANLPDYLRWVGEQGEEEARRSEAGLPPIRRRDPQRFEQVDKAMQKRYESVNDAVMSTMADKWRKEVNPDPHRKPSTSDKDILNRTFGKRLFRDFDLR